MSIEFNNNNNNNSNIILKPQVPPKPHRDQFVPFDNIVADNLPIEIKNTPPPGDKNPVVDTAPKTFGGRLFSFIQDSLDMTGEGAYKLAGGLLMLACVPVIVLLFSAAVLIAIPALPAFGVGYGLAKLVEWRADGAVKREVAANLKELEKGIKQREEASKARIEKAQREKKKALDKIVQEHARLEDVASSLPQGKERDDVVALLANAKEQLIVALKSVGIVSVTKTRSKKVTIRTGLSNTGSKVLMHEIATVKNNLESILNPDLNSSYTVSRNYADKIKQKNEA